MSVLDNLKQLESKVEDFVKKGGAKSTPSGRLFFWPQSCCQHAGGSGILHSYGRSTGSIKR